MNINFTRRFLLSVLLLLPLVVCSEHQQGQIKETIYFFNPESNINNFVSLKISFDKYLAKFGQYQFQPFNDKDIFENQISKRQQGIYLLSSWHFRFLSSANDLQPVMVGVFNGQSTQKKILTVKRNITSIAFLKGKTIACAGSEQYTRNLLKEMLGDSDPDILQKIKLILVPKDIDALMAVGFGMASAALTSERSFENLRTINQKQYQTLRPLMASKEHFLALAAIPSSEHENADGLLDILEKMGINPEGEIRLRMLGLDGWRKLSKQERLLLKQQGYKGL